MWNGINIMGEEIEYMDYQEIEKVEWNMITIGEIQYRIQEIEDNLKTIYADINDLEGELEKIEDPVEISDINGEIEIEISIIGKLEYELQKLELELKKRELAQI